MRYYLRYRSILDVIIASTVASLLLFAPNNPSIFQWPTKQSFDTFSLSLFNVAAALLGFVLASSTFLIAHVQQPRFRLLRRSASYSQLPKLVASTLWRLFIVMVMGGIFGFVSDGYVRLALVILAFASVWAATALAACVWLVIKVYSIPAESDEGGRR